MIYQLNIVLQQTRQLQDQQYRKYCMVTHRLNKPCCEISQQSKESLSVGTLLSSSPPQLLLPQQALAVLGPAVHTHSQAMK